MQQFSDGKKVRVGLLNISEINEHYSELAKGMQKAIQLSKSGTEEKLKRSTILEFEKFFAKFGIDLHETLGFEDTSIGSIKLEGRGDVISGTLIIEYKGYNLLESETEYKKSVRQVLERYLIPIDERVAKNFHAILFDGNTISFFSFDGPKQDWIVTKKRFNDFVLHDWVLLISKTIKQPVSSKSLKNAFSIRVPLASNAISTFYSKLDHAIRKNGRIKMLFNEWDKSFSYIYGGILNDKKVKEDFKEVADLIRGIHSADDMQPNQFLFCFYTYYAFIIKLCASEIASIHLRIAPDSPIKAMLRSTDLREGLRDIESGNFFKDAAGIDNYIEGGFFSWYLDAWDSELEDEIRMILRKLNSFDFESSILDQANSRDILKSIYQEIIPQKIRHDLGEYYTPDWLISVVLNEVGFDGKSSSRVLDPGCGSGGFLVEAINRIKQENKHNKNNKDLLAKIIHHVVGFDVNPVAVLTARTNYLMALTPLLGAKKRITLPIYLADAIITPSTEGKAQLYSTVYWISTVEGMFSLPRDFVDSGYLNDGMSIIEQCVENNCPTADFETLFKKHIEAGAQDMTIIDEFYDQVKKLHSQNKNKIWIKIIQNSFAPIFYSEFDYVVGNPPWIKWDFLSKDYKKKLGNLYLNIYKLFAHKGMKAGMGYSHDDISAVFMYVAIDKYLRIGGKLGFVMKQTLYKSIAGSEFRKFKIEKEQGHSIPLKVCKVNDMLAMQPFKSSARAEASTIILEKGEETSYPVRYDIWIPKDGTPDEGESLNSIMKSTIIEHKDAYPHNPKDERDVWITVARGHKPDDVAEGRNFYLPRHGIVNDLNGVFFVDILCQHEDGTIEIQNQAGKKTKKKVPQVKTRIEKDLVYPFLKPGNIKRWKVEGYRYCIVPQKKTGEKNESELRTEFPLTYNYLHRFKQNLDNRASKWFKVKGNPFYAIFGIGDYSFAPFKVVWSCMSYSPNFAVVSEVNDDFLGKKKLMPDNTIGSISVNNSNEAHYICAILNSKPVAHKLESRSNKSKWGISINMTARIPILKYDEENPDHLLLSELSRKCHSLSDRCDLSAVEVKIDELSAKILKGPQ